MGWCSFDLESNGEMTKITCAATMVEGDEEARAWVREDCSFFDEEDARHLVRFLMERRDAGDRLLSWNGAAFDLRLLADVSGMRNECAEMALDHVDMLFQLLSVRGYLVRLSSALRAMKIVGKTGMSGMDAPVIWEFEPGLVVAYVKEDAECTLALAKAVEQKGAIMWFSKKEWLWCQKIERWLTVRECMELPRPDIGWMTNPVEREDLIDWVLELVPLK